MTVDKEFEAFRAMIMSQFARLAENAGRYVGRMSNIGRESVLDLALVTAWQECRAGNFNPAQEQLPRFWDQLLRAAVDCEFEVRLRTLSGWDVMSGPDFLKTIPALGSPSDE